MSEKKYYWLKLKEDFFTSRRIKKLRRLAGGDTYTIIYLKLQLLTLKTDGVYKYAGIEDNIAQELSLDLDEAADDIAVTLQYLQSVGLLESSNGTDFFLPYAVENTGSETGAAERMRKSRQKMLSEKTDSTVTKNEQCSKNVTLEIRDKRLRDKNMLFVPPTTEEVTAYCNERQNKVDAERFVNYYEAQGWLLSNGRKMADWKAAVRRWEQRDKKGDEMSPLFKQILGGDNGK